MSEHFYPEIKNISLKETGKKRPIVFSADPAFQQLESEGTVYTFRDAHKKRGPVWVRRSRTGSKEFDAYIRHRLIIDDLKKLHGLPDKSGFESVDDWIEKIREYHGDIDSGYVYIVEK